MVLLFNISYPLILISGINVINVLFCIPIIIQIVCNGVIIIHVGCSLGSSMTKVNYSYVQERQQQLKESKQQWDKSKLWQILKVPLLGCIFLLGLYLLVIQFGSLATNTILQYIFVCVVCFYGWYSVNPVINKWFKQHDKLFSKNKWRIAKSIVKWLITPTIICLFAYLYTVYQHWLMTNFVGIILSILAIKGSNIKKFIIALPMLWLLFLYDLYWVYYTDVMVTVATSINLPLKLMLPKMINGIMNFSILGLGDIIVPGLFISLTIKYDVDCYIITKTKDKLNKNITFPLYYTCIFCYGLALIMTSLAVIIFQRAQPALVFIVPMLTIGWLSEFTRNRGIKMMNYNSSIMSIKVNNGIV